MQRGNSANKEPLAGMTLEWRKRPRQGDGGYVCCVCVKAFDNEWGTIWAFEHGLRHEGCRNEAEARHGWQRDGGARL